LLHYVGLPTFQPPPQGIEISLDLLLGNPSLFFPISGDPNPQVLYFFPAVNSRYVFQILTSEYIKLLLLEVEVEFEFHGSQLADDVLFLLLAVGHQEHVVYEGQEVPTSPLLF
jgi:hypothetical protein